SLRCRAAERSLEAGNQIHELHRPIVTNVVEAIRCRGSRRVGRLTAPIRVGCRWAIERAYNAFDNVIDIREIPCMLAIVVDLDRLPGEDRPRELEERHIGPPPWAINGEEAQDC